MKTKCKVLISSHKVICAPSLLHVTCQPYSHLMVVFSYSNHALYSYIFALPNVDWVTMFEDIYIESRMLNFIFK